MRRSSLYEAYDLLVNKRIRVKGRGGPALTIKLGKKKYISSKSKGPGGKLSLKYKRSGTKNRRSGKIKVQMRPRKHMHKNRRKHRHSRKAAKKNKSY